MNKRVLVTGGSGFIGRHTLLGLQQAGFEVSAISHKPVDTLIKQQPNAIWHQCNLLDFNEARYITEYLKPSHLLHLAWYVEQDYKTSYSNIDWITASINLIRAFSSCGGQRAVIAGTGFEYPTDTLYGACKLSLRNILLQLEEIKRLEKGWAWGRVYHMYGPHEKAYRLVPTIIKAAISNTDLRLNSNGKQAVDYLYVQDVANSFVDLINSQNSDHFDIGSARSITIEELTHIILELMDSSVHISFNEEAKYEMSRVASVYGMYGGNNNSRISLERGLIRTINWWKERL